MSLFEFYNSIYINQDEKKSSKSYKNIGNYTS